MCCVCQGLATLQVHITAYLHSIASSSDLNVLGLPLKKLCIVTSESIAVPEIKDNNDLHACMIKFHKLHTAAKKVRLITNTRCKQHA